MDSHSSTSSSRPTTASSSCSTLYGRRKLREEAEEEILKLATEADALKHLWETKPAFLKPDGGDLWIDQKDVDAKIAGITLKFKVNSFTERAERFDYLQSVLKKRWVNKEDVFKSMMSFLIEMSDRPTEDLYLQVEDKVYSTRIEEDNDGTEIVLHGDELREAELKKELFRQEVVEDLKESHVDICYSYSSEEDLSDWGHSDDERSETSSMKEHLTPLSPPSAATADSKIESETQNKAVADRFWNEQNEIGDSYFRSHLRHVEPSPLTDQPVMSSLMALYTRFGEHWEWKKASAMHQRPSKLLVSENDIIRELIWQFTCPNTKGSLIFTAEWTLRPELIVKSLSQSSLETFIADCGKVLAKLHCMRQFIRISCVTDSYPPIFRTYTHALSKVLNFLTSKLDQVERFLKIETTPTTATESARPPTTLVQFRNILDPIIDVIDTLEHLHSESICVSQSAPNWLKALKLISSLEAHLSCDMNPQSYGLVIFLFSECLSSTLDQILKPLELREWECNEYLYQKSSIKITDPNFWNEVVTLKPIEEEMMKVNLQPLSCLEWILPKVLTMLKVQEIMNQLDTESCSHVFLNPLPSCVSIVTEFLDILLKRKERGKDKDFSKNKEDTAASLRHQDYDLHIDYLGFKDSVISGAFHSILHEVDGILDEPQEEPNADDTIEMFYNTSVPVFEVSHTLEHVLKETLDPYFSHGQSSLSKLFKKYNINEAIILLQDIIFGGKEELSLACIRQAYEIRTYELNTGRLVQDEEDPNTKFQNLLSVHYPEGRDSFEIEFCYESKSATNFELKIIPLFPLTLLITPKAISRYEHVSKEIFQIRKGLWLLNRLRLKDCEPGLGVELNRILFVRFSLIQFWSSLRSFVLINAFDAADAPSSSEASSIDEMLKAYENQSDGILYNILSFKIFHSLIIKTMILSTMTLSKRWTTGITLLELTKLCGRIRAAWDMTLQLGGSNYSPEINQVAHFFSPIPEFL